MTMIQRLKTPHALRVLTVSALALAAVPVLTPVAAEAQIGVHDKRVYVRQKEVGENLRDGIDRVYDVINDDINKDSGKRVKHYQSQMDHYEAEIVRLNNLIRAISHVNVESIDAVEDTRGKIFALAEGDNVAYRKKVSDIRSGEGSGSENPLKMNLFGMDDDDEGGGIKLGLQIDASTGGPVKRYRKAYGFAEPEKLYKNNKSLQEHLEKLQAALYISEITVAELDSTRDKRLKAYDDLTKQAKDALTLAQSMEVNNAILLENGRNLAMLIEMQTIGLNAQASQLREASHARQSVTNTFGVEGSGLLNTIFGGSS